MTKSCPHPYGGIYAATVGPMHADAQLDNIETNQSHTARVAAGVVDARTHAR